MTHRKTVGVLSGLGLDWIGINLLCFARPWACHSSTCQMHNLNIQVIVLGLAKDSDSFIHSQKRIHEKITVQFWNPRKNHSIIKKSTKKLLYNKLVFDFCIWHFMVFQLANFIVKWVMHHVIIE